MKATGLNHISVSALDIDASVRFYTELFGLDELPTPNFGFPVRWLRIGDLQIGTSSSVPSPLPPTTTWR